MKITIKDLKGKSIKTTELNLDLNPKTIRTDLIKKVFLALQSNSRQPYGVSERAGLNYAVRISKRRRDYKGSYNKGISRTPRKTIMRQGSQFIWVGALAPNTVGGRRAHPPKSYKNWKKKINKKEKKLSLIQAILASLTHEFPKLRNHKVPDDYPFLVVDELNKVNKTKELLSILKNLGFSEDLGRVKKRRRSGKGKMRGRKYKVSKSVLIITDQSNVDLIKAASNILGVDVVAFDLLNVKYLAPGSHAGRLVLFTESAFNKFKTLLNA